MERSGLDMVVLAVMLVGMLPVVCAGIAKWGDRGYDNRNPRDWLAQQTGFRARANAAQQNSFEAFAFFAVGVVMALLAGVDDAKVVSAAWFFLGMRVAYIYAYVTDRASLRTLVWVMGYATVIYLFVAAL
ncbi:MAG: hypothetical protein RI949_1682 [Pseudomonadota bacterium]|jgi:uncharacterized MAPEG superfamily protein